MRAWDFIVGLAMILGSLVAQSVVIFVVVGLLLAGLISSFGLREQRIWVGEAGAFVLLNWLTWRAFRRQSRPRRALGYGGAFFLLPRGIYRIRYGRETYRDSSDISPA
ncbi:MAG: hypothetical protein ABSB42_12355 [Tepidisphaeraceae bacterium]|jgi:hypothetical protein